MAKNRDSGAVSAAADQTLDVAARADALAVEQGYLDADAVDDDDDADIPAPAAPVKKGKPAALPPLKALKSKAPALDNSLIPDIQAIYGEDAEVAEIELKGVVGVKLDKNPEKRPERVRPSIMPESIYDPALNPELANLIVLFLKPVMQPQEIKAFTSIAVGRNQHPVIMLREGLWNILRKKRSANLEGAKEDRTSDDDDEESLTNKRLILLLEYDVFDALSERASGYGCSNATALGWIVRNAIEAAAWDMR